MSEPRNTEPRPVRYLRVDLPPVDREEQTMDAEVVAIDLARHAAALWEWSFETRHTDPDPDAVTRAAEALEKHARTLRELDASQPR